jgi:HEAT repeat protein
LLEARRDRDRIFIARALVAIGADREDLIRLFKPMVKDADSRVAREAGRLLIEISADTARRHVSDLIRELQKAQAASIIDAIGNLGPQASGALPVLVPLLTGSDRSLSESAAEALGEMGPEAAPAVPELVTLLRGRSLTFGHRIKLVRTLGSIGLPARRALPLLLKILDEPEPAAERFINPAVSDDELQFRAAVIDAIGRIGADTPRILAALRLQQGSRIPVFQVAAFEALVRVAPGSMSVLADLQRALEDDNPDLRIHAAVAIAQATADRDQSVAALIRLLSDEHPRVRTAAAFALGTIGPDARAALPVLHDAMKDNGDVRKAIRLPPVSMMLRHAPPQVPELRQLSLRQAVVAAVSKIDRAGFQSAEFAPIPIADTTSPTREQRAGSDQNSPIR